MFDCFNGQFQQYLPDFLSNHDFDFSLYFFYTTNNLYKNTRNGENGESGKNSQRVGENLNEISRNSPCKVTKVTKMANLAKNLP